MDLPGSTGYRAYGYAHGTAGIGAFLLAAGAATGRTDLIAAAEDCGRTLLEVAIPDGPVAFWPSTPEDNRPVPHWCHGSSGVGTFLCRLYAHTGRAITGGYAVGLSGHLAFLVRLGHGGPHLFHPPVATAVPAPHPIR